MPEYWFSRTRIFSNKDKIYDSVLIRENTGQRKPVFWHILRSFSALLKSAENTEQSWKTLSYKGRPLGAW